MWPSGLENHEVLCSNFSRVLGMCVGGRYQILLELIELRTRRLGHWAPPPIIIILVIYRA